MTHIKIINKDHIKKMNIQRRVFKSKALLINSNDEILMTYLHDTYTFPGGTSEIGESKSDTLIREVKEETGIVLPKKEYTPFYQIQKFEKVDKKRNINTYTEYNYFLINTDEKYNEENFDLDEYEKSQNMKLEYVKLSELEDLFNRTVNNRKANKEIYEDLIYVMNNYYSEIKKVNTKLVLKY